MGEIPAASLAWREGMADWEPLNQVVPPPIPSPDHLRTPKSSTIVEANFKQPSQIPSPGRNQPKPAIRKTFWKKNLSYGEKSFFLALTAFVLTGFAAIWPFFDGPIFALLGMVIFTLIFGAFLMLLFAPVWAIMSLCKKETPKTYALLGLLFTFLTFISTRFLTL